MWSWDKANTIFTLLRAPFMVAVPLFGLYLMRTIVLFIETGVELNQIVTRIVILCAIMAMCMIILNYLIGLISFAAIIVALNPIIIIVIFITTISNYFLLKRITTWNYKNKDKWLDIDRKKWYLEIASRDLTPAKDIRLYNMVGWLRGSFDIVIKQRMSWHRKEETHAFGIETLCAFLSLIREGIAYGLLVYLMYRNNMPAADFVLYFGIIGGFTAWFDGLAGNFYSFNETNIGFNEMRTFVDYENTSNRGTGVKPPKTTFSVEFKNVSYQFLGGDKPIFENFNLKINKGEKLAIVGPNGAGKTTLVKLLCGLYRPTDGEILIFCL